MTDPQAPPPVDPPTPEIDPGQIPNEIDPGQALVEEPPLSPPLDPGEERPYG